jgi:hydroxypyruvate isomerase
MPKFAANLTMMFNEVPFPQRFAAAAQAGFTAVEFMFPYDYPPEEVAGWLKENKLQNVLFNLPAGDFAKGERGLASLPGREQEFRASVEKGIRYAKVLGTPRLHPMSGNLPVGADRAKHRAIYVENVRWAAREVGKHGLDLVLEAINQRDMPAFFLKTQGEAYEVCKETGEPNAKLQFDIYHAQVQEGDITTKLRKFFDRIGHIQIASAPERNEPVDGELNYPYLFRVLDELKFDGWVGCEYRPKAGTVPGLGWFKPYQAAMAAR